MKDSTQLLKLNEFRQNLALRHTDGENLPSTGMGIEGPACFEGRVARSQRFENFHQTFTQLVEMNELSQLLALPHSNGEGLLSRGMGLGGNLFF